MSGLTKFWDTFPDDITLNAFTAHQIDDDDLMVEVLVLLNGFPGSGFDEDTALLYISQVRMIFDLFPKIGRDFSLYTINAFAVGNLFSWTLSTSCDQRLSLHSLFVLPVF